MIRFTAVCGLAALLFAGCQAAAPKSVLDRLPLPAMIRSEVAPPPSIPAPQTLAAPAPRRPTVPAAWIPPGGFSDRWTCIVIHHSASDSGSLRDIDQWHRGQGWEGCGYHFVIGNGTRSGDGEIEVSPRWRQQLTGAHTRLYGQPSSPEGNYYNEHGIGVVLIGNFDKAPPTPAQMNALIQLVSCLSGSCSIHPSRVYTHGELKATDCPGQHFSKPQLRRKLLDALAARPNINHSPEGS